MKIRYGLFYPLGVEDHSPTIWEDADGMTRQEVFNTSEFHCPVNSGIIVMEESNTYVAFGLLIKPNLKTSKRKTK